MNCSFACVIKLNAQIERLNSEHVKQVKKCLWDILGIEDEAQFISKFLTLARSRLSDTIINSLDNIINNIITTATKSTDTDSSTKLYPLIQYQDPICSLPSSIIQQLGLFFKEWESIQLGHVNRRLYIETQNKNYLLQRQKNDHEGFALTHQVLDHLSTHYQSGLAYGFCKNIEFVSMEPEKDGIAFVVRSYNSKRFQDRIKIMKNIETNFMKRNMFHSLFYSCDRAVIHNAAVIEFVPVSLLFARNNTKPVDISFGFEEGSSSLGKCLNKFMEKYNQFYQQNNGDIRNIKNLTFENSPSICPEGNFCQTVMNPAFRILNGNFKHLKFNRFNYNLRCVETLRKYILHPNLESLWIGRSRMISFSDDMKNPSVIKEMCEAGIGLSLKRLWIEVDDCVHNAPDWHLLKQLNLSNIEHLEVDCTQTYGIKQIFESIQTKVIIFSKLQLLRFNLEHTVYHMVQNDVNNSYLFGVLTVFKNMNLCQMATQSRTKQHKVEITFPTKMNTMRFVHVHDFATERQVLNGQAGRQLIHFFDETDVEQKNDISDNTDVEAAKFKSNQQFNAIFRLESDLSKKSLIVCFLSIIKSLQQDFEQEYQDANLTKTKTKKKSFSFYNFNLLFPHTWQVKPKRNDQNYKIKIINGQKRRVYIFKELIEFVQRTKRFDREKFGI